MHQKQNIEDELNKKDNIVNDAYNTIHDITGKLNTELNKSKKLDLKLRQLQFTKLKDLTREVKEKDKQINLLNAKVSTLIGGRPHSLKKDRLTTISSENDFLGKGRVRVKSSQRQEYDQINEVEEDMEGSRRFNDKFGNSTYRTPQKLPSIHNRNMDYNETEKEFTTGKVNKAGKNPKSIYSEMYSNLTNDLKSKKLQNNSKNVSLVFGYNSSSSKDIGKVERTLNLENKLNKINHVIDSFL